MSARRPIFREVRSTSGPATVAASVLAALALLLAVAITYDVFGGFTPRGIDWMAATVALVVPPFLLLWSARLVTQVREDGLAVTFFPLQVTFRRVAPEEIASVEVVNLQAVGLSAAVGIRYGLLSTDGFSLDGPKVYLGGGERAAVRIEREDKRPLVVGTQRPETLREALEVSLEDRMPPDRDGGERPESAVLSDETT